MKEYIVSIDIGKVYDSTTIGVFRRVWDDMNGQMISFLDLIDLDMFTQMPYPDLVKYIAKLDGNTYLSGNYDLLLDGTGVGAAVYDGLVDTGMQPIKIVFTGGDRPTELVVKNRSGFSVSQGWNVPKNDMVDTLALMFQQRRIRIADGIPFEQDIRTQLAHFTGKMNKNKNITYNNDQDSVHDDVVSMMCMAAWFFMQAQGARADFRYKESEKAVRGRRSLNSKKTGDYDPFKFV